MAKKLDVTLRLLEVYFQKRFGVAPHPWMVGVRMTRAAGLLAAGRAVKIVSIKVGYKQLSHFSREFKRYFGVTPRDFSKIPRRDARVLASTSHLDNKVRV